MSLRPGDRLGPYKIQSLIGAGGMGEVYDARDTRLDRTVALKVLPSDLAADPERRQRFEREAKTISALNHPHICTLYDVGDQDGTLFLVMELLEGETLAACLAGGALPVVEALRYASQIADALDSAHRQGIVHRDLKPGNVMLTKAGIKLLDFGLAKPRRASPEHSALPTQPASVTAEGTILGTLQYMAPEQLEGREADTRTDVFAFGAMLYEILTGRRAFEGTSQAGLISAILRDEPPAMTTLRPAVTTALDRLVHACLAKDPDARWQSAGDLGRELRWMAEDERRRTTHASDVRVRPESPGSVSSVAERRSAQRWKRQLVRGGVVFLAGASLASFVVWMSSGQMPRSAVHRHQQVTFDGSAAYPALSPDGERLAYQVTLCATAGDCWAEIEWKDLSAGDPLRIAPTVDDRGQAIRPMWFWYIGWSPDGRDLLGAAGFEEERLNGLYLIPRLGGTPTRLAEGTITSAAYRPGTAILDWIRFPQGLQGGIPPVWQSLDLETQRLEDHELPFAATDLRWTADARWLAVSRGAGDWLASSDANVAIVSPTGEVRDTYPIPGPPGWARARWNAEGTHLYLASCGKLVRMPVDVETGTFSGEPAELIDTLQPPGWFDFGFDASSGGRAAYTRYDFRTVLRLVAPTGAGGMNVRELDRGTGFKGYPALSPDGRDVAYVKQDLHGVNVYVHSLTASALRRVTRTGSVKRHPAWSPDGQLLAFVDSGDVASMLVVVGRNGDRRRPVGRLTGLPYASPFGWGPDSRFVVYAAAGAVWRSDIDGGEEKLLGLPQPITNAWGLAVSPDGGTIALLSHYYPGGGDNFIRIHVASLKNLEAGWTQQFEIDWNEWLADGVEVGRSPFSGWTQVTLLPWRNPKTVDVGYSRVAGNREVSAIWRVTLADGSARRMVNLSGRCSGGIGSVSATHDLSRIVCPLIDASRDVWIVDAFETP